MDGFRDNFLDRTPIGEEEDDIIGEFPVIVAQGERRMQVRAYCHWTNLLGARQLPLIGELKLDQLGDIADHAVLLDFSHSEDDPRIAYVGSNLAQECDVERQISRIAQVPAGSLLARIIGQYRQIIANQAPIGFEEEFVNQRGATILYRGMLLPFASDENGPIRHVLGVINWKEVADAQLSADLARQISDAFENAEAHLARNAAPRAKAPQWIAWADGPAEDIALSERERAVAALGALKFSPVPDEIAQHMALADWLASARELAQTASLCVERTRQALYAAIGRAYDFELVARGDPAGFAKLLAQAGLVPQARAPLVPLVKLVFGADYDKTRLTEYATALAHARRLGLLRGELARHLARVAGGLKGVVAEERRLRAVESPHRRRSDPPKGHLASYTPRLLSSLPPKGAEYSVLVVRRMADGSVALLGEVADDPVLLARAASRL